MVILYKPGKKSPKLFDIDAKDWIKQGWSPDPSVYNQAPSSKATARKSRAKRQESDSTQQPEKTATESLRDKDSSDQDAIPQPKK